jgi:hypothetical protein
VSVSLRSRLPIPSVLRSRLGYHLVDFVIGCPDRSKAFSRLRFREGCLRKSLRTGTLRPHYLEPFFTRVVMVDPDADHGLEWQRLHGPDAITGRWGVQRAGTAGAMRPQFSSASRWFNANCAGLK